MIRRRNTILDRKKEEERTLKLERGGLQQAWEGSYRLTYAQFGKPTYESKEGDDYFLVWEKNKASVVFNLGLAYSYMKCATQRQTVMSIVENAQAILNAPRTRFEFMLVAPSDKFDAFAPLVQWAVHEQRHPLQVVRNSKDESLQLFIRSVGVTDWFGEATKSRPVVILHIP